MKKVEAADRAAADRETAQQERQERQAKLDGMVAALAVVRGDSHDLDRAEPFLDAALHDYEALLAEALQIEMALRDEGQPRPHAVTYKRIGATPVPPPPQAFDARAVAMLGLAKDRTVEVGRSGLSTAEHLVDCGFAVVVQHDPNRWTVSATEQGREFIALRPYLGTRFV